MLMDEIEPLTVELSIYSGKANPLWQLDQAQTQQVLALLTHLKPITIMAMRLPQLGYRGFLVWGGGQTINVYTDMVKVTQATGREQYFYDKGHELERLLIQASQTHLKADLFNLLKYH